MPKQVKEFPKLKLAKGLEYNGSFPAKARFVYAEVKKDGLRGFAYRGKLYTSSGVRIVNAPWVEAAFKTIPKIAQKYVFDGELFYKNCRTTLGIVKTQTPDHPLREQLVFHMFDCISRKEFDAQMGTVPLKRRRVNLELTMLKLKRYHKGELTRVQLFASTPIKATDEAVQAFHKKACKAGHEGTMIKNPESVYSFRKNRDWQKLKPFRESDLRVVDAEIGTKRNSKRLGALILEGKIDGVKVRTKCGGGFKDADRESLWKMHKKGKLVGKIVEVKHEGLTKNRAVRFPEFMRLHPDPTKNKW